MTRVLVDDRRRFADGRACLLYRTSAAAVAGLRTMARDGMPVRELWLDYDLGHGDTVLPVLALLGELGRAGQRLVVGRTHVVTAGPAESARIRAELAALGYPVTEPEPTLFTEQNAGQHLRWHGSAGPGGPAGLGQWTEAR